MRVRKRRAENRSVYGIHEDSSTKLTRLSWKKCIFRGAQKLVLTNICYHLAFNIPCAHQKIFEQDQIVL